MWLTANVGIAEDSGNRAHDQTIRRGQPGANPGPALNICAALDGFCRVAGAVNIGFAAFKNCRACSGYAREGRSIGERPFSILEGP